VRLSDADREQLFEALGRHAAAGRIELEELERRVAAIDQAQTREEAARVMADLPPLGPSAVRASGRPRWGRGHGHADSPEPDWQPTSERFRDPSSKKVMRVWVDSAGGRHYVPDDGA
jgi:Domain of unknown function (DUF1707)